MFHLLNIPHRGTLLMIRSFVHKGLEQFFRTGSTAGIQAKHAKKLRTILYKLDYAKTMEQINFDGARLHPLKGDKKGLWAIKVSGNWRVTFEFDDGDVYIVNYTDYH